MTLWDEALGRGRHHVASATVARRLCASVEEARSAFASGVRRLLDPNRWAALCGPDNARFQLYDAAGRRAYRTRVAEGDFVAIALPVAGLWRTDWVRVERLAVTPTRATLWVRPSHDPRRRPLRPELTAHFFTREASNRFIMERRGPWVFARIEGRDECANVGPECEGPAWAFANRLVAEGGWAGPQARLWERFTRALIGGR